MSRVIKMMSLAMVCALILAVPSVLADWIRDGVPICTAAQDQTNPKICSDGSGGAIIVWVDERSGIDILDIYAQNVDDVGASQWTADGIILCAAGGNQAYLSIIPDGDGGAIVSWRDSRNMSYSDIYAQRVSASGSALWTTDGVVLCVGTYPPGDPQDPQMASDGAGGAIVTWFEDRILYGTPDIYAQRVDSSGTVLWTTNGVPLSAAPNSQSYPKIVSDGSGGAIVAWVDTRTGDSDIYAQRINASGVVQWTVDGVGLCTGTGSYQARICSDGSGGAIVAWRDFRSGIRMDIYAQRVNASGEAQWTANGVALCEATYSALYPEIVSDDAGGAIVMWGDSCGDNYELFAQKVNHSGSLDWATDGVTVCTMHTWYSDHKIAPDGSGGAIVAWMHAYGGGSHWDIYAQRVDASGVVQWWTGGVVICSAWHNQTKPAIASDGAGGALVTWIDPRNGSRDIYCQRVDSAGEVTDAGVIPVPPMTLYQNYPNPFNPSTTITYALPRETAVALDIYDVSGRKVTCLVREKQSPGLREMRWDGYDMKGNPVGSGVYFCRLSAGEQTVTRKIVLLR